MRATSAIVALTGGLALAALPSSPGAGAAAPTCHGQAATIVGTPGAELTGTDGADVVVTAGAYEVDSGAGDDLICATNVRGPGTKDYMHISAGTGDDTVDTAGNRRVGSNTYLDDGDDVFVGGAEADTVGASRSHLNGTTPAPHGHDVVDTGGGADYVSTGGKVTADTDDVDLGAGNDELSYVGLVDPQRILAGGLGRDKVSYERLLPVGSWVIDNSVGTGILGGVVMQRWSRFEKFDLRPRRPASPIRFVGSAAAEKVAAGELLTGARLGGGDDELVLQPEAQPRSHGGTVAGGSGSDRLYVAPSYQSSVALDLRRGVLSFRRERDARPFGTTKGFEQPDVSAEWVRIRGTQRSDRLRWNACLGSVAGGGGADRVLWSAFGYTERGCGVSGDEADIRSYGNRGADVLGGGFMPDVLIGGPGRDVARGGANQDVCRAEVRIDCESR